MKNLNIFNTDRIAELKLAMEIESTNNFPNGNLWNEMSDKIDNITKYGQENTPEDLKNNDGVVVGYKLNNGTEFIYEGMTFENSY